MIITLCGSARFEDHFHVWNEVLTLSGHTVFSLAVYPSVKKGKKNWYSSDEKMELDKAHRRKIDASDAVLILNKFAYIGPSTLKEIKYAKKQDKKLYVIESWGEGFGIGSNHYESVQLAAKKLGVLGSVSPISTAWPAFDGPWDLLPEAGAFRSELVRRLEEIK